QDALGLPALVDISGVDERAARVRKRREQVGSLVLLGILAPGHRAQGDPGDPQARPAQLSLFHGAESTASRQPGDTVPARGPRVRAKRPGSSAPRAAVSSAHPPSFALLRPGAESAVSIIEAVILGLVQGLTEFLPISSGGHLRVVAAFSGWPHPGA